MCLSIVTVTVGVYGEHDVVQSARLRVCCCLSHRFVYFIASLMKRTNITISPDGWHDIWFFLQAKARCCCFVYEVYSEGFPYRSCKPACNKSAEFADDNVQEWLAGDVPLNVNFALSRLRPVVVTGAVFSRNVTNALFASRLLQSNI